MTLKDSLRALPVFPLDPPLLDLAVASTGPDSLFVDWLADAIGAGVAAPHAMAVATFGAEGAPSSRMLLLKDLDESGWAFATERTSGAGLALSANAVATLTFFWPPLGRQVCVAGAVTALSAEESADDYRQRPSYSPDDDVDPDWQVYVLRADEVQFWQSGRERNHQRLVYRRIDGEWERQ